jgi:hypothetical protein
VYLLFDGDPNKLVYISSKKRDTTECDSWAFAIPCLRTRVNKISKYKPLHLFLHKSRSFQSAAVLLLKLVLAHLLFARLLLYWLAKRLINITAI